VTRANPPLLRAATHVALDTATSERLQALGATNVVRAGDMLLIGPSRGEGVEHARLRKAWWSSSESEEWDRLYAPEVRWESPVAIWASQGPADRVNLWRACRRLRDAGLSHRDVLIVDLGHASRGNPDYDPLRCSESVSDHGDDVLLERLGEARPWPRARYDRAVDLWRRYVDADPSGFARACVDGLAGFPELSTVWFLVSSFFPRKMPDGSIHLSRFDELLMNRLSTDWETPVEVYVRGPDAWEQLVCCTGDIFVAMRLDHWAKHGTPPAVERAPWRQRDNPMLAFRYRLTARGLPLQAGVACLGEAPPLLMAGTEAYPPASPWVLSEDGRFVRV
jgi:hypothetical protein